MASSIKVVGYEYLLIRSLVEPAEARSWISGSSLGNAQCEAKQAQVVDGLEFCRVAEEVRVEEGLYGWTLEKGVIKNDESVAHVAAVGEMELSVVQ